MNIHARLAASKQGGLEVTFGIGKAEAGQKYVNLGKVKNVTESWDSLVERLRNVHRTPETLKEFLKLPKEGIGGQDALKASAGFWIGGPCKDGSRKYANLLPRQIVTFDLDTLTPEGIAYLESNEHSLKNYVWCAHTTRKHTLEKPRLRIVVPLARAIPVDLYQPVARILASMIDKNLRWTDAVSFRPAQLMYLPTASRDSDFEFFEGLGTKLVDPDALFAIWRKRDLDPLDVRDWPRTANEDTLHIRALKAEDPWEKGGLIGAFCRAYPIERLIGEHLSDLYVPGDASSTDTRYSAVGSSTANGLVIYEDGRFATSYHGTDPIAGLSVNAWDMARLCRFSGLDENRPGDFKAADLPSTKAMQTWARSLPDVQEILADRDLSFDEEPEHAEATVISAHAEPVAPMPLDEETMAMLGLAGPAPAAHALEASARQAGAPPAEPEAVLSDARRRADAATVGGDTWAGSMHAKRVRGKRLFDSAEEKWLQWTGQRWTAQTAEDVASDVKETSAALFDKASEKARNDPTEANRALLNTVLKLHRSAAALSRMEHSARSEPGIPIFAPLVFDRSPMELTVTNGILDLQSGRCRPAMPSDRVSKLAGCDFVPFASAPHWTAFLEKVMPDPDIRAFLQRFVGYGLTGSVDEEVFALLHGTGANGKSVFCEVVEALLGEFSGSFGATLITRSKNENEATRLVNRLPGMRAAFVNETAVGDVFESQRVKELSSRDKISARPLYAEPYDFAPTHKLYIRTNHLPGSLDAGDGFWRRCIPIAFSVQIPSAERVPDLSKRIIREELPGVLNWALAGCLDWQKAGLRLPRAIEEERRSYREDTDLLGQWLEERTERDIEAKLGAGAAFMDYAEFCRQQGASAGSSMSFSRALQSRGLRYAPSRKQGRKFVGIRLRQEDRSNDFNG